MAGKVDKLSELHQKNMETAMRLVQLSVENSQRLMTLQTDLAKDLFQRGMANAQAHAGTKDPKQLVQLSTDFAKETTQRVVSAAKEIAEIGNASRTEFSRLLTEQLASGAQGMSESLQGFVSSFPAQSPNLMETIQKTMATATGAIDQVTKASSAASSAIANTVGGIAKKTSSRKK